MGKQTQRVAEGLMILTGYDSAGSGVCAEHDQLWAGPDDADVVSADDRAALERLGWHVDSRACRWSFYV
jgi:hypothetical protein